MLKQKIQSFPAEDFPLYGEEIIDGEDGCLIDHYITIDTGSQYHVYQETYLNCWSSYWTRISGTEAEIWDYWYDLVERIQQERGELECV